MEGINEDELMKEIAGDVWPHAPYKIWCTCGKSTVIRWRGGDITGKYYADDKSWIFGQGRSKVTGEVVAVSDAGKVKGELMECGWYCGETGHSQWRFKKL